MANAEILLCPKCGHELEKHSWTRNKDVYWVVCQIESQGRVNEKVVEHEGECDCVIPVTF